MWSDRKKSDKKRACRLISLLSVASTLHKHTQRITYNEQLFEPFHESHYRNVVNSAHFARQNQKKKRADPYNK